MASSRPVNTIRWCILILALLTVGTIHRNRTWAGGPLAIWKDVTTKSPNKPRGHLNLGNTYVQAGQPAAALQEYRRVLELTPTGEPAHEAAQSNIGQILVEQGRYAEAEAFLEAQPYRTIPMVINLSVIYVRTQQLERAESFIREALTEFGETDATAPLLFNLAEVLRVTHRCMEATVLYRRAQRLLPDLPIRPC